jgi:hypothetical protein
MPTDIVSGTTGDVTASGFNGDIDGWSATLSADEVTWRTFASAWKTAANVAYGATGQFTGTIQFNAANTAPASATNTAWEGVSLTLTATTGCTLTGTANITSVAVNRPATDRMTGTWAFTFTGAPVITWDETA